MVNKALYEPPDRAVPEHQVALKLLHEGTTEAEELEFAREAIVTAQFDHPNVIKLVGVVTVGTPTLMVLQYCAQGSLKDVLQQMQFSPAAHNPRDDQQAWKRRGQVRGRTHHQREGMLDGWR